MDTFEPEEAVDVGEAMKELEKAQLAATAAETVLKNMIVDLSRETN